MKFQIKLESRHGHASEILKRLSLLRSLFLQKKKERKRRSGNIISYYFSGSQGRLLQVDPLIYPKCGSEMKIIAVTKNREEIQKIIEHL